jgi:hypothetical protein
LLLPGAGVSLRRGRSSGRVACVTLLPSAPPGGGGFVPSTTICAPQALQRVRNIEPATFSSATWYLLSHDGQLTIMRDNPSLEIQRRLSSTRPALPITGPTSEPARASVVQYLGFSRRSTEFVEKNQHCSGKHWCCSAPTPARPLRALHSQRQIASYLIVVTWRTGRDSRVPRSQCRTNTRTSPEHSI